MFCLCALNSRRELMLPRKIREVRQRVLSMNGRRGSNQEHTETSATAFIAAEGGLRVRKGSIGPWISRAFLNCINSRLFLLKCGGPRWAITEEEMTPRSIQ